MKKRPSVALLVETSNAYARGLLRGIAAYVRENQPWSIFLDEHRRGDPAPNWLRTWKGDGIIARIENRLIAEAVSASGLPTVDLSMARLVPSLPFVETDDENIARLAADHLLERRFQHFGYCGVTDFKWSDQRREYFTRFIQEAGYECSVLELSRSDNNNNGAYGWEQEQETTSIWIKGLPKPVGIMACYDNRAHEVLEACRRIGVLVPEEVAVVGVDNDEILCELSDPPLTSVMPDTYRTGYEAAALLDRLMSGETLSTEPVFIKPKGIAVRQSTDTLATDDRLVSEAVRFIRYYACEGIRVSDVMKEVGVSRRVLEHRFRQALNRTPHAEIVRIQLDRVKSLLTQTDLPLAVIAEKAGFAHVEYMTVVFKKKIGINPSQYRTQSLIDAKRPKRN